VSLRRASGVTAFDGFSPHLEKEQAFASPMPSDRVKAT